MSGVTAGQLELRDLRQGGRWTASQWLKNTFIYLGIRALLCIVDRMPSRWLLALGRFAGRRAHAWLPRSRATARANLARSLPERDAASLARRCFERAGENAALMLLLRRPSFRALDLVDVPADTRARLDGGVVFVCAHLGPFELVPAAVAELGFHPAVVVRESYDPRLDPVVDAHRSARGIEVIHRGRPAAARRIVRGLRAGRPLGLLPDLGGRVSSREVAFLGRPASFPVGPARLAERTGKPLVVGTLRRLPTGNGLPRFQLTSQSVPMESDLTQRVADALSQRILREPEEWLWMAPRFR